MSGELSPLTEEYLAKVVADGIFPSKEAALEAAVAALREKTEEIPPVPVEHHHRVEEGLKSADAGRVRELSDADWEQIRDLVRSRALARREKT